MSQVEQSLFPEPFPDEEDFAQGVAVFFSGYWLYWSGACGRSSALRWISMSAPFGSVRSRRASLRHSASGDTPCRSLQAVLPSEYDHAGIIDGVPLQHVGQQIFVGGINLDLAVSSQRSYRIFQGMIFPLLSITGTGDADLRFGVFFQLFDAGPEEIGIGQVVAFGNPDIASACEPDSFFPIA